MKNSSLYLGLVLPSGGWQSLTEGYKMFEKVRTFKIASLSPTNNFEQNFCQKVWNGQSSKFNFFTSKIVDFNFFN